MTVSRTEAWRAENDLMDCMAILAEIRDHCAVARRRIYNQAPCKQTFVEITAAVERADELGAMLSACWERVYAQAQKEER